MDVDADDPLKSSVAAAKPKPVDVVTAIDKTTANARRVLEDEAEERAEKMARLKAAREKRDSIGSE